MVKYINHLLKTPTCLMSPCAVKIIASSPSSVFETWHLRVVKQSLNTIKYRYRLVKTKTLKDKETASGASVFARKAATMVTV